MVKPKAKAKPKAKRKITAKEKRARALRAAFNRVCDFIEDGPKESVGDITADRKIGISRTTFYRLLTGGDRELRHRYAQARARSRPTGCRPDGNAVESHLCPAPPEPPANPTSHSAVPRSGSPGD